MKSQERTDQLLSQIKGAVQKNNQKAQAREVQVGAKTQPRRKENDHTAITQK